jgi:hypothetical protein
MSEDKSFTELSEDERLELYGLEPGHAGDLTLWQAPGPDSLAFLNDTASLSTFLMGPVGQGKTTTMCLKRVADGAGQGICKDGWVRDRALVLRKTWRTAKATILKSWHGWFPKNYPGSTFTGGEDRPATHVLRFQDPVRAGSLNPVKVELETDFMGLDDNDIEVLLRGRAYSRIVFDETDQFSLAAIEEGEGRVGRYPDMKDLADGEKRTKQVTGAFNAPDKSNFLHDMLVEKRAATRSLHAAPAGLDVIWNSDGSIASARVNPAAENLKMLDPDYYTKLATAWEDWKVRRLILNQWGYSRDGLPVFVSEFREHLHVAKQLIEPNKHLPLIIGADGSTAGLRPAGVFLQPDGAGFLNHIQTFAPGQGYGAVRFWEGIKAIVDADYRGCTDIEIWVDPAGQYGGDKEGGQLSFHAIGEVIMGRPIGIPFNGSNEIALRLDTVRKELTTVVQGEARRYRISPHPSNKIVINGFASAYRFKRRPAGASSQWEAVPDKMAECSDPMDATQYAIGGFRRVTARQMADDGRSKGRGGPGAWGSGRKDFDVHGV